MPGNFLAKYFPRRQEESYIMNGGIHHAPSAKIMAAHKNSSGTVTTTLSVDEPDTPTTDPAQIKFLPRTDSQRRADTWRRGWTTKEKYLLLMCVVLFLVCVIVVVVALTAKPARKICMSKACVKTAAQLMSGMDFQADPCEDFFQYACGQWNKMHTIPEDKSTFNTFDKLHDQLEIVVRELLEVKPKPDDSSAILKAKSLFQSCLNVTQMEALGDQPLRDVINDLGSWPILDEYWTPKGFIMEDVLSKLRGEYNAALLFDCKVAADDKNSSVYIIQFKQASLGMSSRQYFLKDDTVHVEAYLRYMQDVVNLLGGKGPDVRRQLQDIIKFETRLAKIMDPSHEIHDTGALYHKMTLKELQKQIPQFDMLRYLRGFVKDTITEDEPIVVFAADFMKDAFKIVQETDLRTVANYLIWRLIQNMAPRASAKFKKAYNQYNQVMEGVKREEIQWKYCVELVNKNLGLAVGAMFIKDNFKEQSKTTALDMIHDIREAFNELLVENEWMDAKTREFAKEKANAMNERIGYPEFITDSKELDKRYEMLLFRNDEFFQNILRIKKYIATKSTERLRQGVQKDKWEQQPVLVNAFYDPNKNDIVIPAGILQPSFYSPDFPKSLNFGGIGVVIGHEITHGFDDKGRQYDKEGNIKQWWDNHTIQAFTKRAQCVIDQYSNYKLEQIGEFINGKLTIGENIADNGGLKQSYRAYRTWVQKHGEEHELPGIGLNHNQLFFLNYAQIWCGKIRDEKALNKILTSTHSPGSIRVLGPLSNSKEFSKAYSCKLGTRMNPVKKCSVW